MHGSSTYVLYKIGLFVCAYQSYLNCEVNIDLDPYLVFVVELADLGTHQ